MAPTRRSPSDEDLTRADEWCGEIRVTGDPAEGALRVSDLTAEIRRLWGLLDGPCPDCGRAFDPVGGTTHRGGPGVSFDMRCTPPHHYWSFVVGDPTSVPCRCGEKTAELATGNGGWKMSLTAGGTLMWKTGGTEPAEGDEVSAFIDPSWAFCIEEDGQ